MTKTEYKIVCDYSKERPTLSSYVAVHLWLGWLNFYPALTLSLPFMYMYLPTAFNWTVAITAPIIVLSAVLPITAESQPAWTRAFGSWTMNEAKRYFSLTVKAEDPDAINDAKTCLFSLEPHDVLPVSIFWGSDYIGVFPKLKSIGCMSNAVFNIPIMRHVYTWMSASSADRKNCEKLFAKGYSLTVNPGGVKEVSYLVNKKVRTLYLRTRQNFTKLAIQNGAMLVPMYTFNQDKCFDFIVSENKSLLQIGRKLGFLPMIFFGLFGIPLGVPKPVPLTVIMGKPIRLPQEKDPSKETVEKYHLELIAATEKIYNDNKNDYGVSDVPLVIE